MNNAASEIVTLVLSLAVIIAAWRIYGGAVQPLVRNWRLARRGFGTRYYSPRKRSFNLLAWIPTLAVAVILIAIALPAYHDYVVRAHDNKRLADLRQIEVALSLHHLSRNAYPVAQTQNTDAAGFAAALAGLVSGGYIVDIPRDPVGGDNTYYYRSTADGSFYCLGAKLERSPPASSCDMARLGGALLGANYAIGP